MVSISLSQARTALDNIHIPVEEVDHEDEMTVLRIKTRTGVVLMGWDEKDPNELLYFEVEKAE